VLFSIFTIWIWLYKTLFALTSRNKSPLISFFRLLPLIINSFLIFGSLLVTFNPISVITFLNSLILYIVPALVLVGTAVLSISIPLSFCRLNYWFTCTFWIYGFYRQYKTVLPPVPLEIVFTNETFKFAAVLASKPLNTLLSIFCVRHTVSIYFTEIFSL